MKRLPFQWSATCNGCAAAGSGTTTGSWSDATRAVDEWIAWHRATAPACGKSPVSSHISKDGPGVEDLWRFTT